MKNTFGESVAVTLFGESHGEAIGAVLDGIAPGIPVDEDAISAMLARRRPAGKIGTARRESDDFRIVSGVFAGKTTGAPLCVLIPNEDKKSSAYETWRGLARPGHADLTAFQKYHGFEDYRGGGHFSGRLTAPLVTLGAVALCALAEKGIALGTHIARLENVKDREWGDFSADFAALKTADFPMLDGGAANAAREAILAAAAEGDSVGGVLESAVLGMPAGVGEPFFDSVESRLSHALFSIPAVKGVEFGDGFALAAMRGSKANDPWRMENGVPVSKTNRNGGVNGGISNGMPITFRTAVKPTPSIFKEQETVDFLHGKDATLSLAGRHDPAIVHRAAVVVDAMTALTLLDLLSLRFGTDFFGGGK